MTKRSKFGWVDFLLGALLIALGFYTFFHPQIAMSSIVLLYSILAIVTGIVDIVFFVQLKSSTGLGPTASLVAGILSVLAGFMLLLNPVLGTWIFGLVFAIWFIAHSISRLANYRYIHAIAGKAVSILSVIINGICIVLGVVLLLNPAVLSTSLGYIVAIALVLHGVGNVIEAFSKLGEESGPEGIE